MKSLNRGYDFLLLLSFAPKNFVLQDKCKAPFITDGLLHIFDAFYIEGVLHTRHLAVDIVNAVRTWKVNMFD